MGVSSIHVRERSLALLEEVGLADRTSQRPGQLCRAVHWVLGAGCVALALLAAGSVLRTPSASASPQLIELRPSRSCDAASILRSAGATTVAASLRLYRVESNAAARVLPRLRACRAVRFTTPDSLAGTMTVMDFTDPLVDTEWWREAIGVTEGLIRLSIGIEACTDLITDLEQALKV